MAAIRGRHAGHPDAAVAAGQLSRQEADANLDRIRSFRCQQRGGCGLPRWRQMIEPAHHVVGQELLPVHLEGPCLEGGVGPQHGHEPAENTTLAPCRSKTYRSILILVSWART